MIRPTYRVGILGQGPPKAETEIGTDPVEREG